MLLHFFMGAEAESSNEYSSFTTNISAQRNFYNVNVYGQSSYSYPSKYSNRREISVSMIIGYFSYPTYMVG